MLRTIDLSNANIKTIKTPLIINDIIIGKLLQTQQRSADAGDAGPLSPREDQSSQAKLRLMVESILK